MPGRRRNIDLDRLAFVGDQGRVTQIAEADAFAEALRPVVRSLQAAGATTLDELATALNAREIATRRNRTWHGSTAGRLLTRYQRTPG